VLREIEIIAATWLVTLRVVALWSKSKAVRWVIWIAFIVMHVVNVGLNVWTVEDAFRKSRVATFFPLSHYFFAPEFCVGVTDVVPVFNTSEDVAS
jgi:hypothetical protein